MDELVSYLGRLTIEKATTVPVDFEAHARRDGHGHEGSANQQTHHSEHHHDNEENWVAALVLARRPIDSPES